ncbi:MAG: creatininase family protein [Armatimonadota bacterium]
MPERVVQWTLMTPDDLDAAIKHMPLALVPCGSLEWHGPHLATGCDALRGHAICTAVAQRLDGGVVLPPLYTTAPGFCNWRGTISFTPDLVKRLAAELYRELEKCGFRHALMLLSHAGAMQEESFREPAEAYMANSDLNIMVRTAPRKAPESRLGPGHAQADESAELLVAEPRAVHLDRYAPERTAIPKYTGCDPALYCRGLSERHHEAVRRFMAREHYQWQQDLPAAVTPEAAQRLFDSICDALADELRQAMAPPP